MISDDAGRGRARTTCCDEAERDAQARANAVYLSSGSRVARPTSITAQPGMSSRQPPPPQPSAIRSTGGSPERCKQPSTEDYRRRFLRDGQAAR